MLDYSKYKDNRSMYKYKRDIKVGSINCRKAMIGLCAYLNSTGRGYAETKVYEEKFWEKESDVGFKQDADLIVNHSVTPFEVKVAPEGLPEEIFLRYWSIKNISLLSGKILLVSEQEFSILDGKKTYFNNPVVDIEMWGGKKGFKVLKSGYRWSRFITKIDFLTHRQRKS